MSTTVEQLRPELPPLPDRMKRLKLDRGYPVPWFVPWILDGKEVEPGEGEPEFRVASQRRLAEAVKRTRCWLCGQQLGKYRAYVIGPMCLVNRVNAEPPSHLACAEFAAKGCPFLARPHMRRREAGLPEESVEAAGMMIHRNPGVTCVYTTVQPVTLKGDGKGGILIDLPEPTEVSFFAEGRAAKREEVVTSIETGLPILLGVCQNDDERTEVRERAERAVAYYAPAD